MAEKKETFKIRSKILGVLLRDARLASGKSLKECGAVLNISGAAYGSFERGKRQISLPQLEVLARFLDVPMSHFWDDELLTEKGADEYDTVELLDLRHRILGAQLRQARKERGLTQKELARAVGISTKKLQSYEYGERPVPVPELEVMAEKLGRTLDHFIEGQGPIGEWIAARRAYERFVELPPDVRAFVAEPINEPYLRVAMQLSGFPVERLRGIAEGLLDITL